MPEVVERVDRLEEALERFTESVGREFNKLYNSQMRTEAEMRAFKEEMREFKDEMRVFKDEMRVFKDEMSDFKDEMSDFKDEMSDFKDEMRTFKEASTHTQREMNRRWGELANKMGTMVEDLVHPSLPRLIEERFSTPVIELSIRHKRRLPDGESREFDAIALTDTLVFLNSTKASLRSTEVDRFVEEISAFRRFFPEYAGRPLVGVLASLAVDEGVLAYAARQGFLVLAVGDQLMEIQNSPAFVPKQWLG